MADNYTELYYHLIWGTKNRNPFVEGDLERQLFEYINRTCDRLNVRVLALNGMPDHVHIACVIPTSLSIATVVQNVKGGSAKFINGVPGDRHFLAWQPGYGALTFSRRDMRMIVSYIQNQKQHHESSNLLEKMEITTGLSEIIVQKRKQPTHP